MLTIVYGLPKTEEEKALVNCFIRNGGQMVCSNIGAQDMVSYKGSAVIEDPEAAETCEAEGCNSEWDAYGLFRQGSITVHN